MSNRYRVFWNLAVFTWILSAGCSPNPKESEKLSDIITAGSSAGGFRGVSIRDTQEEVRRTETLPLILDTIGQLKYSAPIGEAKAATFTVFYTFDQYGLFEIQADLSSKDTVLIAKVSEEIRQVYANKYGEPERTGSGYAWTTVSPVNSLVEIRTGVERSSKGMPFLSINFFEPMEDEI